MKNPWKGLASYEEADCLEYEFRGRTQSANDIYRLLSNNLFCTLYGKTGCGKTSLLQAGVFPLLRQESFLPIVIRLNTCQTDDFAEFIIQTLYEQQKLQGFAIKDNPNWSYRETEQNCSDYKLWYFFYSHSFVAKEGKYVFPVIAIDQIEEAFKDRYQATCELLTQLYYLVSDDLRVPENCYPQFRTTIIIREDYLYLLEDAIQDGNYKILCQNRYRLAPLTDDEAREVIELGRECFPVGEEEAIINKVILLSKDESAHISTYMLSLVCSQLFITGNGIISLNGIQDSNTKLLLSFYKNCIHHVLPETKSYIENNLISEDFRKIVTYSDFKSHVSEDDIKTLTEGEYKLVQKISVGDNRKSYVELLHDSLAKAIKQSMDEEEQKKAEYEVVETQKRLAEMKKRAKRIVMAVIVFVFVTICVGLFFL